MKSSLDAQWKTVNWAKGHYTQITRKTIQRPKRRLTGWLPIIVCRPRSRPNALSDQVPSLCQHIWQIDSRSELEIQTRNQNWRSAADQSQSYQKVINGRRAIWSLPNWKLPSRTSKLSLSWAELDRFRAGRSGGLYRSGNGLHPIRPQWKVDFSGPHWGSLDSNGV